MTTFRVWAPAAAQCDVVVDSQRHPMTRDESGWWAATVDEAAEGTDYAFSVDGAPARPDPRSPWQPQGVDGPSRVYDHDRYVWAETDWRGLELRDAVIYELHIGTFTREGTYEAARKKLDHLVELGIDAIELCPVNQFSGKHGWGYDGVDLFAPHHAYGSPDHLKALVDDCHAHGLGVIMDVVYNHLGPAGNYLATYGPYFTARHSTPWGDAVNFDERGSHEVRRFVVDNALMWLQDYRCDGLRIDAIHAIVDTSAVHILEQLAIATGELADQVDRKLFLIAESDLNDPRVVTPRNANGLGIDAQWSDDFHHALHAALTGETTGYYGDFGSLADIAKALRQAFVYDWRYSRYRDRMHGRRPEGLGGRRFLGYLQDHDQIGNRALGDRSSMLMDDGLLKIGAALVLTSPFVPMLFMGEEWGAQTPFQYFSSHPDPELGRAVSEGRRREFAAFGWDPESVPDPQDPATFERSKLDWSELDDPRHRNILEWHRDLIALRKNEPDLHDDDLGAVEVELSEEDRWLTVRRGSLTVACDLGNARQLTLPDDADVLLTSDESNSPGKPLEPHSVVIYRDRP